MRPWDGLQTDFKGPQVGSRGALEEALGKPQERFKEGLQQGFGMGLRKALGGLWYGRQEGSRRVPVGPHRNYRGFGRASGEALGVFREGPKED